MLNSQSTQPGKRRRGQFSFPSSNRRRFCSQADEGNFSCVLLMRERERERERERALTKSLKKTRAHTHTHTQRKKNPCAAACARTQYLESSKNLPLLQLSLRRSATIPCFFSHAVAARFPIPRLVLVLVLVSRIDLIHRQIDRVVIA